MISGGRRASEISSVFGGYMLIISHMPTTHILAQSSETQTTKIDDGTDYINDKNDQPSHLSVVLSHPFPS